MVTPAPATSASGRGRRRPICRWFTARTQLLARATAVVGVPVLVLSVVVSPAAAQAGSSPVVHQASKQAVTVPKPAPPSGSRHVKLGPKYPNAGPLSPLARPSTKNGTPNAIDLARHQAKATGKPVHIASLDTVNSTTYAQPDQQLRVDLSSSPIRVATASGLQPVDPTLVADASGVHPKMLADSIHLSPGGSGPLVSLVRQPGPTGSPTTPAGAPAQPRSVSVGAPGALPAPVLSGDTATYPGAVPGADLVVRASTIGFEVSLLYRSAPSAPPVIDLPFSLRGLQVSQSPGGELVLTDGAGKVVGRSPAPEMFDSTGNFGAASVHHAKVPTSLKATPAGQVLELRPDPAFFANPAVAYPVTVDPPIDLADVLDNTVDNASPDTNYDDAGVLFAGNNVGSIWRSFIQFSDSTIKANNVTGAGLLLYQSNAYCQAKELGVATSRRVEKAYETRVSWLGLARGAPLNPGISRCRGDIPGFGRCFGAG